MTGTGFLILRRSKLAAILANMKIDKFDNGKDFDFGKTSLDYSKYRDIYPDSMYEKLFNLGIGLKSQNILDLGTGTGVFPRAMHKYGAKFTGIDISEEQIKYAKFLSEKSNMEIQYRVCSAESTGLDSDEYDIISAVQCFQYFNREKLVPEMKRLLKKDGKILIIFMPWLPYESKIAEETEKLVLKYNPNWTGGGQKRTNAEDLHYLSKIMDIEKIFGYTENLEFNYETWAGRIRACRGVSAALPEEEVAEFNKEHLVLLKKITEEPFQIIHEIKIGIFRINF